MWNTGSTLPGLDNLDTGMYSVRVIDNKGCYKDRSFVIRNLNSKKVFVTMYPNPVGAGHSMILTTGSAVNYKMNYVLMDVSGRIVHKSNLSISHGFNKLTFSIPVIAGMYYMKYLHPDGTVSVKKIIVY